MEGEFRRSAAKWSAKQRAAAERLRKERARDEAQRNRVARKFQRVDEAVEVVRTSIRQRAPPVSAVRRSAGAPSSSRTLSASRHDSNLPSDHDADFVYRAILKFKPSLQQHTVLSSSGDRVLLPQSALNIIGADDVTSLVKYPLLFHLYCPHTGASSHCGVLEFSAPEHTIVLPPKVQRSLRIETRKTESDDRRHAANRRRAASTAGTSSEPFGSQTPKQQTTTSDDPSRNDDNHAHRTSQTDDEPYSAGHTADHHEQRRNDDDEEISLSQSLTAKPLSSRGNQAGSNEYQLSGHRAEWELIVTYVSLDKGVFARLDFSGNSVNDLPFVRNALEAELRLYATLTVGDVLTMSNAVELTVAALEPGDAVCVVDTELTVDLQPADAADDSQAAADDPSRRSSSSSSTPEEYTSLPPNVEELFKMKSRGELRSFRLKVPDEFIALLNTRDYQITVNLETDPPDGGDLFLSFSPLTEASPHTHHLADFSNGPNKVVTLSLGEVQTFYNASAADDVDGDRYQSQSAAAAAVFDRSRVSQDAKLQQGGNSGIVSTTKTTSSVSSSSKKLMTTLATSSTVAARVVERVLPVIQCSWPTVVIAAVSAFASGGVSCKLRWSIESLKLEEGVNSIEGVSGRNPIRSDQTWAAASTLQAQTALPSQVDIDTGKRRQGGQYIFCNNCKKEISAGAFELHSAHCLRHCGTCAQCGVVLRKEALASHWHCPICSKAMDVSSSQKHHANHHEIVKCDCGRSLEIGLLRQHRSAALGDCPKRLILCRYCGRYVQAGDQSTHERDLRDIQLGLTAHEAYCGCRSVECPECHKPLSFKYLAAHMEGLHPEKVLTAPSASHDTSEEPVVNNKGAAARIQECDHKDEEGSRPSEGKPFVPCAVCGRKDFDSGDDWSRHFEAHASDEAFAKDSGMAHNVINERDTSVAGAGGLLAEYFSQLTRGCGDFRCRNVEACSTAWSNNGAAPRVAAEDVNGAAAIALRLSTSGTPDEFLCKTSVMAKRSAPSARC